MEDEDRRDLISTQDVTAPDSGAQRNYCSRGAVYSAVSILVALLIAGQAVTVYFVYQQSGQISKLTKTSQNLQLEALTRKLPQSAKPTSKLRMAKFSMPMVMRELPLAPKVDMTPLENTAKLSNSTTDQVKHLLLRADPSKMFPELQNNLMENLNHLKNSMTDRDWQSFESWMHKWLLFEMAKTPQTAQPTEVPADEVTPSGLETEELMYSGVDLLKLDSGKEPAK
ncbi:HLA class II histocompatibility antigen gamma chain isoform X2 [Mauremys reevesii]|uniref:HLA class II histocompatibility antigen gamma chain isoform X2 n=1 Tax=Mauremys reevesii TaxID=260615 RepID=UPI00193F4A0F|nr:HLA class II histocompatibility antigen gamma chain isoform X2 [Mauremys reevesii]